MLIGDMSSSLITEKFSDLVRQQICRATGDGSANVGAGKGGPDDC